MLASGKTEDFGHPESFRKALEEALMRRTKDDKGKDTCDKEDKGNIIREGLDGIEVSLCSFFIGASTIDILGEEFFDPLRDNLCPRLIRETQVEIMIETRPRGEEV